MANPPAAGSALNAVEVLTSVLLVLCASFLLSVMLTPAFRSLAQRRGWLDRPDGGRKAHPGAVPRVGGLAVHLGFVASFVGAVVLLPAAVWQGAPAIDAGLHLIVAGSIVMLVGLLDDIGGMSPAVKVLSQITAALYLYWHGYRMERLSNPFGQPIELDWLSLPLTLLWIVGLSNAFNLIDGLDGLAAGVGLFASCVVFTFALLNQSWETAVLSVALAGALLGFLRYNFAPASVFLGDCGSLFTGFVLAALSIRGSTKTSTAVAVITPLLALGFPIVDTALTVVRRLVRGRSILEPDADHIHHRMVQRGLTPQRAVILLYGVTAVFCVMGLLTMTGRTRVVGLAVGAFTVVTWVGIRELRYRELQEMPRLLRGTLFGGRGDASRVFGRVRIQLEQAADLTQAWKALSEGGERLGLDTLELELGDRVGGMANWKWRAPRAGEAACWTWSLPLVWRGLRLGQLALTRALDSEPLKLSADELETLAEALTETLARLRPPSIHAGEGAPGAA